MNGTANCVINDINIIQILIKHQYQKEEALKEIQQKLNELDCSEQEKTTILSNAEKFYQILSEAIIDGMIYKRKAKAKYLNLNELISTQ